MRKMRRKEKEVEEEEEILCDRKVISYPLGQRKALGRGWCMRSACSPNEPEYLKSRKVSYPEVAKVVKDVIRMEGI